MGERQTGFAFHINTFALDAIQGGDDLLFAVSAMAASSSARARCAVFFLFLLDLGDAFLHDGFERTA